ncbi:MAG: ABC transporter substrate-binding protein [Chloroflexi bacterium]|nr:ABC transporter substrate-binding protein [Chloroflexota bacterium]
MEGENNYWTSVWQRRLSRRQTLTLAGKVGMGLAGATLLGCAAAPAPTQAPSAGTPRVTPAAQPTPTAAKPVYGGTLIHAIGSNMTEDPGISIGGGYDQVTVYHLYNTLLHLSKKITLEPELALSWENPDKTTFIYKLRKGVKFHDGADFNAQAVKANFDRLIDKDFTGTAASEARNNIKAMEVVDEATVKFTIKATNPEFAANVLAGTSGGIVSPQAPAKSNNDLRQRGVGSGPFQAAEWSMDSHITMKKFPGYWDTGLPYLDQITWKITPDGTVRMTTLRTGDVQFIMDVEVKDIANLQADPNVTVVVEPGVKRNVVHFNMRKEPFSKKAARQAVAYAVDRQAISDAVYKGIFKPAEGIYPPTSWAHDPTIKNYPYDLQKAKEKLAEAGYPNGFEFKAVVASARPDEVQTSEIIKDQLAKVGIKMTFSIHDQPTVLDIWQKDIEKTDAIVTSAGHAMEPIRLIDRYYTKNGSYANIKVDFPELEALVAKAKETYDLEEQRRYLNQADRLVTENVWAEWAWVYEAKIFAFRKNVMNYEHGPHPFHARFRKVWLAK